MHNVLVAYFSASGVTAKAASQLVEAIEADLYEICPEVPYTQADLNWMDQNSRSSVEMKDPASRPAIHGTVENMGAYDVVFVGFPIWWYVAPTIINAFLESYDWHGKIVIPFATSGGSGMGSTNEALHPSCQGAKLMPGKMLNGKLSITELREWAKSYMNSSI